MRFVWLYTSAIFMAFIMYACFVKENVAAVVGLLLLILHLSQIRTMELLEVSRNESKFR
jgi:hypothetical protein